MRQKLPASGSAAIDERSDRHSDESVAGAQVNSPLVVVPSAGSPRPAPRRRVDLTSRFLQFGVLENQRGQRAISRFPSRRLCSLVHLPRSPLPEKLQNDAERKSMSHHAVNIPFV